MKHSIEWQNDAANASTDERATVGDLRLFLNDRNVTMHLLDGQIGDHVTVALYGLVDGIVRDWWKIFGARDTSFSFRRYRTGYLLPDIRISFDGSAFEFSAHELAYRDPDLRFWGGADEVLSRAEGEASLSRLVTAVLERLDDRGLRQTGAAARWRRVQASLLGAERSFCEAAGGLGLDPYHITDEAAAFIERAEALFETEALVEFVAAAPDVNQPALIDWVGRMVRSKGFSYRLANLRPLIEAVAKRVPPRPSEPAWSAGYRRARAMRQALALPESHRFSGFRDIAVRFGAGKSFNLAPRVDGISALRAEGPHGINIHVRNHGDAAASGNIHAFALARAIGDAACFPAPQAAPINHLRNAYRQAAGRAFAAEFLAPVNEVMSMHADARDGYTIASEFGVDHLVIERQMENRERIEAACA